MLTPTQLLDIKISRLVNNLFLGNYKTAFKGSGIEFADLREYEQGDSYRSIDWITSAKQGKLYIKKYEEERQLTVLFLVDVGQTMQFGITKNKQETLLETLYLLAFSALKNNDKIGALIYDEHIHDFIPPAKNKANLIKIVNTIHTLGKVPPDKGVSEIARFQRGVCTPYSNTLKALQYLNITKQKNCLIFVLTDDMQQTEQKNIYKLASIKNEIAEEIKKKEIYSIIHNMLNHQYEYKEKIAKEREFEAQQNSEYKLKAEEYLMTHRVHNLLYAKGGDEAIVNFQDGQQIRYYKDNTSGQDKRKVEYTTIPLPQQND